MKRQGRILIVDDDPTNVDIFVRLLRQEYELETASTGNECLAKVATFRPQLVLLDIMMPGINGHETCRRIKLSPLGDSVRVILVSAKETIVDRKRGSDVLADDYIIKPFDHAKTLAKVRDLFIEKNTETCPETPSGGDSFGFVTAISELKQERIAAALRRLEESCGTSSR